MPENQATGQQTWITPYVEQIKTLGLPTVLCCIMMWVFKGEIDKNTTLLHQLVDYVMTTQNEQSKRSTAAIEALPPALNNNSAVIQMLREDMKHHADLHRDGT